MTYWPAWTDPLRHPRLLRQAHRIWHRRPDEACILCRYVWRRLEAQPGFIESVNQGIADLDAGRLVPFDDDPSVGQVDPT